MNENAKRSAESILMLYVHFSQSFRQTSGLSTHQTLLRRVRVRVSWEFPKKMSLIEYRIVKKFHDFIVVDVCIIIHEVFTCDSTQ